MNSRSSDHHYYYNAERRAGSSSVRRFVVYGACLLAVWFTFNGVYNSIYKPYMKFWDDRTDLVEQSREYLTNPDGLCAQASKSQLRVKIPEYDQCRIAERRLRSSPPMDAFTDLMEYLQFCAGGQCMVFSVNLFGYIGWLFWGFVLVSALLVLAFGAAVASVCYRNLQANYVLPLTGGPVQQAAMYGAKPHDNRQFVAAQPVAYPPQHSYDLNSLVSKLSASNCHHDTQQQHVKQQ